MPSNHKMNKAGIEAIAHLTISITIDQKGMSILAMVTRFMLSVICPENWLVKTYPHLHLASFSGTNSEQLGHFLSNAIF